MRRLILAAKTSKKPSSFSTPPWWFYPLIFLVVFAIYIRTLNPSLFRNDSPETITACFTLGVSHPPGYPLYTLLGRLFALIPIGNPAMTINFFSAFLGAVGVCLFFANLWFFSNSLAHTASQRFNHFGIIFVCFIGSLCFAFSKSYWSLSLAAKGGIYTFQVALELGLLLYFQSLIQNKNYPKAHNHCIYFLVFIFALGSVNHWPSLMLLIPPIAFGVLTYSELSKAIFHFGWEKGLTCLTMAVVVLSLYLYLPLRSHLHPALDFGSPFSFKNLCESLFRISYFKRETLASFMPTALSTIQDKSVYISNRFGSDFNPAFSFLSFWGVFLLWRCGHRKELLFLLLLLLTTVTANILYLQVSPIEYWHLDDHLITVNWVTAFLASAGIYLLFTWVHKHSWLKYALPVLLIALPILTFQKNISADDQTKEFLYRGYGMEALKSMNQNARYFAESDYDYFSILYLQEVEHKRPDVALRMTTFLTENDWKNLSQEVSSGSTTTDHPIYCAFPNGDFINGYLNHAQAASFKPNGLVTQFMPIKLSNDNESLKLLREFFGRYISPNLMGSNQIDKLLLELCAYPYLNMANYLKVRHNLDHWGELCACGICLISENIWRAQEEANAAEGYLLLKNSKINKKMALDYYMVSGDDYWFSGQKTKAKEMFEKAIKIDPTDKVVPYIQKDLNDLNGLK